MSETPLPRTARAPRNRLHGAPGRVLVVADTPHGLQDLRRSLEAMGHRVHCAHGAEEADPWLGDAELDVALLDLQLGGGRGIAWLEHAKRSQPALEIVVLAASTTVEVAVEAMRRGAFDVLVGPSGAPGRLARAVTGALERRRLLRGSERAEAVTAHPVAPFLVGASKPMRELLRTIESLRRNESHVLLQGESGTGKELVARALHATSRRAAGPFVPVDCGALPESIIESELFGHEKGAFTGAVGAPGLFRRAHGGTLFLDEIGEIPLGMQAKLLRALQEREVRPVGAAGTVAVDLRVISATHRDLGAMVAAGRFRADLFYRLHVVRIALPPLRDRREDIPLLVQHCLRKHRRAESPVEGVDPDALARLVRHPWPGNVRELENVVESALALARGPRLGVRDLDLGRGAAMRVASAPATGLELSLDAYERCALERALAEAGGDATRAARLLGLGRSTFYRKLAKHGIARATERRPQPGSGAGSGASHAIG